MTDPPGREEKRVSVLKRKQTAEGERRGRVFTEIKRGKGGKRTKLNRGKR